MEFKISKEMTAYPFLLTPNMTVDRAICLMAECKIHHLPVVEDDKVVGVISDRDLLPVSRVKTPISEVMTTEFKSVPLDSSVTEAVAMMRKYKIGSVLITDNKKSVIGIFTITDALRLLERLLESGGSPEFYTSFENLISDADRFAWV